MVLVTILGLSGHSACLEAPNRFQDTCPVQNPAQPKPAICCLKTYIDFFKNCCFPFYFIFLFINEDKTKDFRDPLLCFLDMSFNTMASTTEVQTETVRKSFWCAQCVKFQSEACTFRSKRYNETVWMLYIFLFFLPALIFISACSMGWFP